MKPDAEMLRRFVEQQANDAFTDLVQHHIGLVHATALRRVGGDVHLAHDVTQAVFITLARKAPSLLGHTSLAGWLYVCTQHAAAEMVRGEQRRKQREAAAHSMQPADTSSDPAADPARLRSLLDDAIITLKPDEREAVVLRFFGQRTFAEVGAALRISEEAARKRVDRSVEKLHAVLTRRGLTSTLAALGGALTAAGSGSVPAALAGQVSGAALAQAALVGAGASASTALISSWLPVGAAAALILAGSFTAVSQHRANAATAAAIAQWERENPLVSRSSAANPRPLPELPPDRLPAVTVAPAPADAPIASMPGVSAVQRAVGKAVVVSTEGALSWEGEPVRLDEFLVLLAAHQRAAEGKSKLVVKANGARFRQMCWVLDEARKAGVEHVVVESDAAPDSRYPFTWF
ncbi:MAG TPA: sigma-70 family RNA polymerase sigma factor [Lacunisphaera sp.]|nr:sigma-70 family RNA polymerase sigma factor [Lacunisphaera sp.]